MDIADQASDLQEHALRVALANSRVTGNETLTGFCKNCHEPTRGAYCSSECRTDETKRERMRL